MCVFNSVAAGTSCHLQQKKMPKNSTDFFIHNKNFKQDAINLDTYLVEFIFVILIMCMCTFLCVGMHTCVPGSRRPEVLDSLGLGWPICRLCWEKNPGPLLEQSVLVTAESCLQPCNCLDFKRTDDGVQERASHSRTAPLTLLGGHCAALTCASVLMTKHSWERDILFISFTNQERFFFKINISQKYGAESQTQSYSKLHRETLCKNKHAKNSRLHPKTFPDVTTVAILAWNRSLFLKAEQ